MDFVLLLTATGTGLAIIVSLLTIRKTSIDHGRLIERTDRHETDIKSLGEKIREKEEKSEDWRVLLENVRTLLQELKEQFLKLEKKFDEHEKGA